MHPSHDHKYVLVTPPAAKVDNAAFTTTLIDTVGFNYLDVLCIVGDTDIAMVALKLRECDQSNESDIADIPNMAFGGAGNPALPSANDDNKIFHFGLDLVGRKRFIDVSATAGDGATGTFMAVVAVLSRAEQSPDNAAKRGVAASIIK
jgi:hypothetical protein